MNLRRRELCNWRESVISTENFRLWETRELMQRTGGYLWRSMCILWMTSSLSSHSTCASVSELSRLVTHTAVSLPKCNSEKRPLSNSVAFRTLFKWHRYCGILKIHIVRKKNTGIRYEPVYRPALHCTIPFKSLGTIRFSSCWKNSLITPRHIYLFKNTVNTVRVTVWNIKIPVFCLNIFKVS